MFNANLGFWSCFPKIFQGFGHHFEIRLAACFCLPIFQNFKFSKLRVDINEKETFERELQNLEDEQNNRVRGFREVIDLISTSQKPVVAHNSLNDDASESNIHGHDVLRISELFAKLCTILKIAPVTHEDENGHLPSVLEDYTNIFNPCSTSSQDHTIDEDVSVWTDNRRKVDNYNIELENQSGETVQLGSETDQRAVMMGLMLHANAKQLIRMERYKDALEVLPMGEELNFAGLQKISL
ncbi:Poly(A)-specific ribonuclease PARN-like [Camellia lanceoleosa]|uniref:Poly(A)-specific ribonuclease PARN-like n=1 Tax=Camellia lanceoleosa TaxID=1840588 RepID=A0ACC0IX70_9ERIC|nr:Poly(A)-specific ribonuclease PARN-like [Camellia lanceoleosa]